MKFFQLFIPDRRFESTEQALKNIPESKEGVILDIDGVLVDPGLEIKKENIGDEIHSILKELFNNYEVCVLSNRAREEEFNPENIDYLSEADVVEDYLKPGEKAFKSALEKLGVNSSDTVMVGDSPYTDIYGANRMGIKSFQVEQDRSKYSVLLSVSKRFEDGVQGISKYLSLRS